MPDELAHDSFQPEQDGVQPDFSVALRTRVLDAAMFSLSLDRRIEYWNPAAERIYGWRADEVVGKRIGDVLDVEFMSGWEFETELAHFMEHGHWVGELNQRRSDGSLVHVLSSALLFRDPAGKPHSIVVISHDLSQQKQYEAALHQSEERYRAIYRDTPCMFFTLDAEGIVISVNEFGATQLGYTIGELVGKPVISIFHEDDRPAVLEQLQICLRNPRQVFQREFRKVRRDGSILWIESFSRMVINAEGQPNVLAVCQDITERRKAEDILRQAFAKEKELSELKSRFVSMASHEFRTPLATILASAEMIGTYRHRMTDSQIDQKLDNIRSQVDYLKNIVEDVLQYTALHGQKGAFKPTDIDLDLLCREIIDEFRSQPQTEHRLEYNFEGTHELVLLDKRLMRQIIINLLSNAIKYSPEVSPIRMTLRQMSDWLILSVQDEGIGVPAADIYRLFEPFHRAANAETIAGTGLGLTIVKEAVELHGGSVRVESQPGVGTSFVIRIPTRPPRITGSDLTSNMEA